MAIPDQFDSIPFSDLLGDRLSLVVKLREQDGKTFTEIGQGFGVTSQRVRQLYCRAKKLQDRHTKGESDDTFYRLSTRAANCLRQADFENRQEVLAAFKDRSLHPSNKKIRNFGWKSYYEIAAWLGLPPPQRRYIHPIMCPHCGKQINEPTP